MASLPLTSHGSFDALSQEEPNIFRDLVTDHALSLDASEMLLDPRDTAAFEHFATVEAPHLEPVAVFVDFTVLPRIVLLLRCKSYRLQLRFHWLSLFFFWFAGCGRLRRIGFGKKRRDSGTITSVLENRKVESGGEDETGGKAERIGGGDAMSGEI